MLSITVATSLSRDNASTRISVTHIPDVSPEQD
jgi:hypothetical protein